MKYKFQLYKIGRHKELDENMEEKGKLKSFPYEITVNYIPRRAHDIKTIQLATSRIYDVGAKDKNGILKEELRTMEGLAEWLEDRVEEIADVFPGTVTVEIMEPEEKIGVST